MAATENANLTTQIITMVLAIVIVGAVMIPIINGLTNPGNSNDGGMGNNDTPQTLMNDGIPYAKADNDTHTMNIQLVDDDFILTVDSQQIDVGFNYTPLDDENPPTVYDSITLIAGQSDDGTLVFISLDMMGAIGSTDYNFFLYLEDTPDVTLTITSTGISYDGGEYELIAEYLISATGDYVMTANPHIYPNTEFEIYYIDSQQVMAHNVTTDEGEIIDDLTEPFEGWPMFTGSGYIDAISNNLYWEGMPYVNPTFTVNTTESEGYIILNNIQIDDSDTLYGRDGTITESEWTMYVTQFIVPKSVAYTDDPIIYTNIESSGYYASADTVTGEHTIRIVTEATTTSTNVKEFYLDGQSADYRPILAYTSDGGIVYMDTALTSAYTDRLLLIIKWMDGEGNITEIYWNSASYSANGKVTLTFEIYIEDGILDAGNHTHRIPVDCYRSYVGDYVVTYTSDGEVYVANQDMKIYIGDNIFVESQRTICACSFDSSMLTTDMTNVQPILIPDPGSTATATIYSENLGAVKTIKRAYIEEFDADCTLIVPKSIVVPYGDNTDDGGNGNSDGSNNVVNTILTLVPVFVIIGIIGSFAIPMISNKIN